MKKKRKFAVINETFVQGWSLHTRLILFGAAQFLNVLFTVMAVAVNDWKFDATSLGTSAFATLLSIGLQAFILGSFDVLTVFRDERGRATLTRNRRFAFIPMQQQTLKWKKSVGVGLVASPAGSLLAWGTFLYLFCCLFVVPGVLFWLYELKPDRFNVILCDVYGGEEEFVFQAKSMEQGERVVAVVADATTLTNRRTL